VGAHSIVLGNYMGYNNAIPDNVIALNATVGDYNVVSGQTNSFYVNPIRQASTINSLYYNTATKEITYDTVASAAVSSFTSLYTSSLQFSTIYGGSNSLISTTQLTVSTLATRYIDFPFTTNLEIGGNGTRVVSGNHNIALGYSVDVKSGANSNVIAIGHGINVPSEASINLGYSNVGSYPSGANIGSNTICLGQNIGADGNNVYADSIVFNAAATPLGTEEGAGLYINPVRYNDSNVVSTMMYNPTTKELSYRDGRYFSTLFVSTLTDSTGQIGGANQVLSAGSNGGETQWVSTATNLYNGATIGTHDLLPLTYVSSGQIVYSYDNTTPNLLGMAFDSYHGGTTFLNTSLSFSTISSATPNIQDYNNSTGNDGEVLTASTSGVFWKPPVTFSTFTINSTMSPVFQNDNSYTYSLPWTGISATNPSIVIGSVYNYDYNIPNSTPYAGLPLLSVGPDIYNNINDVITFTITQPIDTFADIAVQVLKF
jgi:hypothetical protein